MLFSLKMTRDRSYSQELYKGLLIVRWLFQDASVVNLCSLVLERYFAIVMPFKYVTFMTRERVVQLIFIPWALTIIFILLEASLWIGLNSSFILKIFIWPAIIFYVFLPCSGFSYLHVLQSLSVLSLRLFRTFLESLLKAVTLLPFELPKKTFS